MPLGMVHLSVAYGISAAKSSRPTPRFLLGAIAPDSIHMRTGATRIDKRRVHLMADGDLLSDRFGRIDQLLAGVKHQPSQDFLAGWVSHLASDFLWSNYVNSRIWDHLGLKLSPEEQRNLYYRENDKTDFTLYHTVPWREDAWDKLRKATAKPFQDLLTAEEIAAWKDRMLRWFTELKEEPVEQPHVFTMELIQRFISFAADICVRGFHFGFAATVPWIQQRYPAGVLT